MNASRARRRWLKWCRYTQKTQSQKSKYGGYHSGQVLAFSDATFAGRAYPRGARDIRVPRWSDYRRSI